MSLKGVVITKGKVGANVAGKPFQVGGLLTTGIAVADKLALGQMYVLTNLADTEALGLDEAYDTTNNVVVYEHIAEYYRMGGEGKKLFLMVAPQTQLIDDLIDKPEYAQKLIADANGEIYTLAIGFNPDEEYEESNTDGLNSDVRASIVKAQALHQWSYDTYRPVNVILEGRGFSGTAAAALNLRAIPASPSGIQQNTKVSIVIGQDYAFASTLDGLAQKHAAIGTALGTRAACEVNQNIGEVETFNLTDELVEKFTSAGLSSHVTIESVESQLATFDTKGYIFPMTYTGISGYRWNDDHVCAPVILDAQNNMNEHSISLGATHDFCVRRQRQALLPEVKKVKPVDAKTGLLPLPIIKSFEGIGNDVFADLAANGWISGGKMTVDPSSDLLIEKVLDVSFAVVPYGTVGEIRGVSNLKIKF